jgi:hypothetical protein
MTDRPEYAYGGRQDKYAVMYRHGAQLKADDESLPRLTRLVHYGLARVDAGGHAQFERGELMDLFKATKKQVYRLVQIAIRDGWITEQSCSECLVFGSFVSDRRHRQDPCPIHSRYPSQGYQ